MHEILSERSTVLDNPNFRAWFGNSKIVDTNGQPLRLYHGTNADFTSFESGRNKVKNETGIFFSPNPAVASMYSGYDEIFPADQIGTVMPVYLKIENPLIVDFKGNKHGRSEIINQAIASGHDGVILRNHYDAGGVQDQYVVFHPNQIKSVFNQGDWSSNNSNIMED